MNDPDRKIIEQIRELDNGFCNPMKNKQAEELREELWDCGYSRWEIEEMLDE